VSAQDRPRHSTDEFELLALLVGSDPATLYRRRKPALRAQRQSFDRNESGRLMDSGPQLDLVLQRRLLGRNEAEHSYTVFGDLT